MALAVALRHLRANAHAMVTEALEPPRGGSGWLLVMVDGRNRASLEGLSCGCLRE